MALKRILHSAITSLKSYLRQSAVFAAAFLLIDSGRERGPLLAGKMLSENMKAKKKVSSLRDVEFKVFSQFGDDGIIQWLVGNVECPNKTFIEFGVEDYQESNTRFLLMNDNWSGLVMDGSESNIARVRRAEYSWSHELFAKAAFIDAENINQLLPLAAFDKEVGILSIDLDGNDYWIWKEINVISPIIVILEYNSVFGIDRAITISYERKFVRTKAHYSNLYFGASLRALNRVSMNKGYAFIGCNSAGNNAYFVRRDKLNDVVVETSVESGFVLSKIRESLDALGNVTYLAGNDRLTAMKGMPVYNVDSGEVEPL